MITVAEETFSYQYFISTENKNLVDSYYGGLSKVLKKYNVEEVILSGLKNKYSENTHIVLAQDQNNDIVGGVRIEIKSPINLLPIEKCEIPKGEVFGARLKKILSQDMTVAEICGMWADYKNKKSIENISLGAELSFQGLKYGLDLGIDVLTAIVPRHTLVHTLKIGFIADPIISDICYPDDRYLSTVIWYYNPQSEKAKGIQNQKKLNEYNL